MILAPVTARRGNCHTRLSSRILKKTLVREMGLEPTRQRHWNLNPARLPIPPLARAPQCNGCARDRPHALAHARRQQANPRPSAPGCVDCSLAENTGTAIHDHRLAARDATRAAREDDADGSSVQVARQRRDGHGGAVRAQLHEKVGGVGAVVPAREWGSADAVARLGTAERSSPPADGGAGLRCWRVAGFRVVPACGRGSAARRRCGFLRPRRQALLSTVMLSSASRRTAPGTMAVRH